MEAKVKNGVGVTIMISLISFLLFEHSIYDSIPMFIRKFCADISNALVLFSDVSTPEKAFTFIVIMWLGLMIVCAGALIFIASLDINRAYR